MANEAYQPTERRPMPMRQWWILRRTAETLASQGCSPNLISIVGMVGGMLTGFLLASTPHLPGWERAAWLAAAFFVLIRSLCNLLDGMVAIESGKASPVGELYNDVPDRVSDSFMLMGAGYSLGGQIELGYLAACVTLFTAYVRVMGKAAGAPHDYCGPMAKPQRMAIIAGVSVLNALIPTEWRKLPADPEGREWMMLALGIVVLGGMVTSIRRLVRIGANLRRKPS